MFIISTIEDGPRISRNVEIARRETFAEAEEFVKTHYSLVSFEIDADYPGQGCADFFTIAGVVGKIEPEGFKAKPWQNN